jgi:outer membrane protein TolC
MLKKILLTIMIWIGFLALLSAQDGSVTLDYCLSQAIANHPLFDQYDLLASSSGLKIKNLNKNYLPDMNINGDAHYQSTVTEIPAVFEAFAPEPLSKDQYKISLDVSEMIYDGGITKRNKDVENIDNEINRQNVGIDLYRFKDRVIAAYYNIISLQESRELLEVTRQNLESRLKEVESGVKNGVVLSSNAEIIKAELLKIDQKEIEIEAGVSSGYKVLSILTGDTIAYGTKLQWGNPVIESYVPGHDRLEYNLFSLQQQKAESLKKLTSSRLVPKLWAYGQAGYGRPGFNMLLNEFDDYYIIGAKLSWNFYNWNKTRNEKSILDLQKEIVTTSRESFDQNLSVDLERRMAEILKIETLLPKDEEIVSLRAGIVQTYASQLQNGVITATEYITELHAETEARLNLKIHQIQLVRAKYEYLSTAGKL